jgi:hypothetical protein
MAASSTAAGATPTRHAAAPDPIVDRTIWERLRRAASRGQLQPEGFKLVDLLHDLYPHWRAQW